MPTRVLLMSADDRERLRLLEALEAAGYAVRTATDAQGVLAGLADRWPDLVVLDLSAPELDAMDLLWRLVNVERPVPIIISHGPRNWGRHLSSWLARGFRQATPATCQMIEAVSRVIRGCSDPTLLPVA